MPSQCPSYKNGEFPAVDLRIPDLAVAEAALKAHKALRPEPGTPGYSAWCARKEILDTRIDLARGVKNNVWSAPVVLPEKIQQNLAITQPPPPQHFHSEAPMPPLPIKPTISPEEQLDTLLAKLSNATGSCVTALDKTTFKTAQNMVHQYRWQIRRLVEKHGLESPVLPALPTNPWSQAPATRAEQMRAARSQPKPPTHRLPPPVSGKDLEVLREKATLPATRPHDPINHPAHYQGDIECIDAIRAALGPEGFQAYCRGNVLKYAWRAGRKGAAAEDLAKAAWYAEKASKVA